MLRRPYHAGSQLIPPPRQTISDAVAAAWITRIRAYWPRANARAGKIARALVRYLGDDGRLMPSLKTLADAVGCHEKTVQRWVEKFEQVGFLRKFLRRSLFGQTSNAYLILSPGEPQTGQQAPLPEQSSELSFYSSSKASRPGDSMDSLPPDAARPAALRRVNKWLGVVLAAVRPAPQEPRFTVEEYIALLAPKNGAALE